MLRAEVRAAGADGPAGRVHGAGAQASSEPPARAKGMQAAGSNAGIGVSSGVSDSSCEWGARESRTRGGAIPLRAAP